MGNLYIVSTPIGNRQDITLRGLEVMKKVEVILCEDTRKTGQLLNYYKETQGMDFKAQLISFYEEVEERKILEVINLINSNKDVALVSDAGTPLLSDPGFKLVRECVAQGVSVIPVPGASALLTGLVVSGLPMDKFTFLGFLPKKSGKRIKVLKLAVALEMTTIFYESPFRIVKTLKALEEIEPKVRLVLGRELTKKFEEVMRGKPNELLEKLAGKKVKGEIVLILSS